MCTETTEADNEALLARERQRSRRGDGMGGTDARGHDEVPAEKAWSRVSAWFGEHA